MFSLSQIIYFRGGQYMRPLSRIMLIGCLVVAAPLALARGGGGSGVGGGTAGGSPGVGNAGSHGNSSAHGLPSAMTHSNGPLSLDRDHGIERAEDRMSQQGRANTNGNRSKGKARPSQRYAQHKSVDEPDRK